MIILQSQPNNPPPPPIHHPAAHPPSPPPYLSALSYTSTPPSSPPSPPPPDIYLQATGLSGNSTPFGALTGGAGGGGGVVGGTPVTSDDSPSLPAVAFNQWKSYFGDEQRGSCFFHELLYNRITQPESPVAPSLGIPQTGVIDSFQDES